MEEQQYKYATTLTPIYVQKVKQYKLKTLREMEKLYKNNPGLEILKKSSSYEAYVQDIVFDSFAIGCILESNEASRGNPRFENSSSIRAAFSI